MSANGVDIASVYVTVLAKMPGIAKSINSAIGSVDTSTAGKKIGQQISAGVGKSLKDQVAKKFADATAAAFDKQTAAAKKLADAEHELLKARAQHGTSSAKVSAAEERLTRLRESGKASAADLERAEANLAKAQADVAGTSRGVVSAQNQVAEAKRNATDASKAYADAVSAEGSKAKRALEWMPLANQRIDEIAGKWTSAGEKITSAGDFFTNHITKPVSIATGAVSGLVGVLGFKRLIGIDTARGQFQGLGLDADAVMKQVDAGVTNTALSMAEGASLAVGILATGNLPLEGLESQLKRVANVSAAYGVESSHAGYLLNNVLTKNKVTYGDLSQMVQNNIPIISDLAKYYGVAGDEIEGMAQRGEISVADFNTVLDQNAGAAAEAYAGTWKGVTSNILSNLGRIGAKFLEPTFNIMKDEASGFLQMLKTDEFSTFAADIGDRIGAVVKRVADGIRDLIAWWNGLSDGQKRFIGVAAAVAVALGPVLKLVGGLFIGIGKLVGVGKVVVGLFTGWKAAAGGAAIGSKLLTGQTVAQTGAMTAGAAAQRILNAAMEANVFIKIAALVLALVGALVWFFTQTKTGKKLWAGFMGFLKDAWKNISSFFKTVWETILKPVFDGIGAVVTWVWTYIIQPTFQAFQIAFAILGGILAGIWETILKPVFDAIGAIFTWLYDVIIAPTIFAIKLQIQIWAAIFTWLWNTVLKPIFAVIGAIFGWIYNTIIKPIINGIVTYVKIWAQIFTWLYENAVKPAFDRVAAVFNWIYNTIIKPIWDGIANVIKNVWENGIKPVIDTLVRIIQSDPKKAFEAARDAIGDAWKGIQDLAKAPVRFVIETVINGLIDTINLIPGVDLPKVPLPAGFAHGGILPGMSRMGDGDDQLIAARRGEGIMVSEALRSTADRNAFLAVNAAGRRGVGFASMLQGFATGGLIHPMPQGRVSTGWLGYPGHYALDFAAAQGTPIRAAGDGTVIHSGWDAVPGFRGYGNVAMVQHRNGLATLYAHMLAGIVGTGAQVKQGQQIGQEGSTGNSTGPHLHYEVWRDGTPVNPADYLTGGGAVGTAGLQEEIGGLAGWAMGKLKEAFPGSDMWIDMAAGMMKNAVDTVIDVATGWIPIGGGVPALYDSGGWLPTGKSLVENRTGKPEPIFTGSQWADISSLAAGGGSGGDGTAVFHLYDSDDVLRATMDGRIEMALQPVSARALQDTLGV